MSAERLTIGNVQIYFDELGAALFSSRDLRERSAVEAKLIRDRDFIDRWLEASEEARPRRVGAEEQDLRVKLKRLGRDLGRSGYFPRHCIETVIREIAKHLADRTPALTQSQISESIEDALSTL